jgi:3-oxoacyl-[acyl-carrier protein] reductase
MRAELQGKAAIVTGGSKGIGYAVAESLARAGSNVVICARNADEVEAAARRLDDAGEGRVIGQRCDMRSYDDVRNLITRTVDEFDRIDVLVNNAGVGGFAPVDEISTDQWARIIETNLSGVFYACREAVPHMKRLGASWIINIGSLAGKNPIPGGAAYNASKFGLLGFTEAMMLDVRHQGIRVSTIMPGSVATHFGRSAGEPSDWKLQPADIAEMVMDLLAFETRALPSRVEMRPSQPPRKS